MEYLSDPFPTEVWYRIVENLDAWDALKLRAASRRLYAVVTLFDEYWYRQFTWYLVSQDKKAAMFKTGCDRRHKQHVPRSQHCLSIQQEEELAAQLGIPIERLTRRIEDDPSILDGVECTNVNHYVYDLPKRRSEMPLNRKDYKPGDQIYLYRFLIHNYRQQRQSARNYSTQKVVEQLKAVQQDLEKQRVELTRLVARCKKEIRRTKRREASLQDMARRCKKLEHNRVFHGRRSRQYKGLAHLLET